MMRNLPFSWKALLIAPLVIPLACAILYALLAGPARVPQSFTDYLVFYLIILGIGCFISYGAVIFLLLPALFIASRFVELNKWRAGLVGLCASLVVYFCHLWVWHRSSGPDSGPPTESFIEFLRMYVDPFGWDSGFILGSGVVTAMLYWALLVRKQRTGNAARS